MTKCRRLTKLLFGAVIVMLFSVLTAVSASAASYDLYIDGTRVTDANKSDILKNGLFSYDSATKTLTVKGDYSTNKEEDDLIYNCIKGLTIKTTKALELSSCRNVIYAGAPTTLITNGELKMHSVDCCAVLVSSITANNTFTIKDSVINASGYGWAITGGIESEKLIIDNSRVIARSEFDEDGTGAITDFGNGISLTNCKISEPAGAYVYGGAVCLKGTHNPSAYVKIVRGNNIEDADIDLKYTAITYTGSKISADKYLTIKLDGKTLLNGTDYTTSYKNNVNVGYQTCEMTISGKGKYSGTVKKLLTIKPKKNSITTLASYNGGIRVEWNKDDTAVGYQVVYCKVSNFDPESGTYHSTTVDCSKSSKTYVNLTSVPKPGETWYVKVRSFITKDGTVNTTRYGTYSDVKSIKVIDGQASIAKATLKYGSYTYSGSAITPDNRNGKDELTVKDSLGNVLKKGTDYTLTYSNNTKVGKATIKITGKGNYKGTLTKTFVIKPAVNTIKAITSIQTNSFVITYNKATACATGYQILYCKDPSFDPNSASYHSTTVTNLSTLSKTVSSNVKSGETWYVKIRSFVTVDGTRYGNYSSAKSVKIK